MLPKFSEEVPKTFFELFEHFAGGRNWPDRDRVDMLQVFSLAKLRKPTRPSVVRTLATMIR